MTNQDLKEFAEYLAKADVIDGRRQKALSAIQPEKARAAAFGPVFTEAFDRVKALEHKARSRGYRDAEMKIVSGAVDALVSFAKGNSDKLANRNVSSLREAITSFERNLTMITYEEGDYIMSIRDDAEKIVSTYQAAIPALRRKAMDATRSKQLDRAQTYLSQIQNSISGVSDGSSADAAKLEKQMCEAIERWGAEFGNENFAESAMKELAAAAESAKGWAELKPLAAKKGLFGLKKAPAEAEPGSYVTYEAAMANPTHRRMFVLSQYFDAVEKVEQIPIMVQIKRANSGMEAVMEMEAELDNFKQERTDLNQKLDSLLARYEIATQSGEEVDYDLMMETEDIEMQIEDNQQLIETTQQQISDLKRSASADESVLKTIEQTYRLLHSQEKNESNLVSLAAHVKFDVIRRVMDNTATPEDMATFVNFDALTQAATRLGIDTRAVLRDAQGQARELVNQGRVSTGKTPEQLAAEREKRQQEAKARMEARLAARRTTQTPVQQTESQAETQTTGGISLDGLI